MGVPVVTFEGERFLSRQGVGLLANAGRSDWIAENREAYVDLAVARDRNLEQLAALRVNRR